MALTTEEILRAKLECGYNVTGVGAEVYLLGGYAAIFDQAIQPYLIDYGTTSTSVVTGSPPGITVTIVLASNPAVVGPVVPNTQTVAFVQGSNVVIDVGPNQESSVVQTISGLSITVQISNSHGVNGAYPVKLRGSEQFIRDIFARLDIIAAEFKFVAPVTAGVAKVDGGDVSFYGAEKGRRGMRNKIDDLVFQREVARDDLCFALGIPNFWKVRKEQMMSKGGSGGGGRFEVY